MTGPIDFLLFIAGIILLYMSWRSWRRYQVLKSPTSYYLTLFGLTESTFFFLNSIPFFLTSDVAVLKWCFIIGNFFYYLAILVTTRLIWHLTFHRRFKYRYLFVPVLLLCLFVLAGYTLSALHSTDMHVADGALVYTIPNTVLRVDACISLLFVLVSLTLMREAFRSSAKGGRNSILAFAFMYLGGGLIAIYNTLFLHLTANSPIMYGLYAGVVVFFLLFIFIGRANSPKP